MRKTKFVVAAGNSVLSAKEQAQVNKGRVFFKYKWKPFRGFSPFYPSPIIIGGVKFPTLEHFFHYLKMANATGRKQIMNMKTGSDVYKISQTLKKRKNWNKVMFRVMYRGLQEKYRQNPALIPKLLATGQVKLFKHTGLRKWGFAYGKGKNMFGKLLMKLREEIKNNLNSYTATAPMIDDFQRVTMDFCQSCHASKNTGRACLKKNCPFYNCYSVANHIQDKELLKAG